MEKWVGWQVWEVGKYREVGGRTRRQERKTYLTINVSVILLYIICRGDWDSEEQLQLGTQSKAGRRVNITNYNPLRVVE